MSASEPDVPVEAAAVLDVDAAEVLEMDVEAGDAAVGAAMLLDAGAARVTVDIREAELTDVVDCAGGVYSDVGS